MLFAGGRGILRKRKLFEGEGMQTVGLLSELLTGESTRGRGVKKGEGRALGMAVGMA